MSEELLSKYTLNNKIEGQHVGEFEYFNIGNVTFNQLRSAGLISSSFSPEYSTKKPDRIIIKRSSSKSHVYAVIEDKDTGKFSSEIEKNKAIRQCNNYCQELGATVGIITDGSTTIWINPSQANAVTNYEDETNGQERSYSLVKKEDGSAVNTNFSIGSRKDMSKESEMDDGTRKTYLLIKEIVRSVGENNSVIKEPERLDPLPLAQRVWQGIWVATGKSPEKCLYNVVELFIFKFLSDLKILSSPYDFNSLYALVDKNTDPDDILRFYVNNCRKEIYRLFPKGVDGTTIINGTIFVDEKGEANTTQSHLFKESIKEFKKFENEFGKFSTNNIDKDFKTRLYEAFLKQTAGLKALGQFFTPRKVVRSIVEMSGVNEFRGGEKLCDPFCGVGGFVLEPLNLPERANDFKPINGKIVSPVQYIGYDKGFEKDEERTIILAKANMLIYLAEVIAESKLTQEFAAEAFNKTFTLWRSNLGTLEQVNDREEDKFDLILTNPPYVKRGIKTLKAEISENAKLKSYYSINGGGLEGLAIEWIVRHLKKGGRAFVVVPDGIMNRLDDRKLRNFILNECLLEGVISLPQKTFYATPKKTYILVISKKRIEERQTHPVFTYLVSNVGETLDANRFETPEKNDLGEMVLLFNQYKSSKNNPQIKQLLEAQTSRCKVFPVAEFEGGKHWSIDRWWSKDEKIELGIEEEVEEISPEEFLDLLTNSHKELGEIIHKSESILKKNFTDRKNLNTRLVSLDDSSRFKLAIGKRLLKKDLFRSDPKSGATIPAYSANVFIPFGFVPKSNLTTFDNPYVLWGIDGNFDLTSKAKGEIFATTDHCGTIEILDKDIDPEYLLLALELKKYEYGFDRGLRSSLQNVKAIEIEIPISKNSRPNLSLQKKIAQEHKSIFSLQQQIGALKSTFEDKEVAYADNYNYVEKSLGSLFKIKQGNAVYTKKLYGGNNWMGSLPVYSSNTKDQGLLMKIDRLHAKVSDIYYQKCLTWAIDGYAGKIFIRNESNLRDENSEQFQFVINNHCGILLPLEENIYLPYIKSVIQPIFFNKAKGYGNNKLGTNQIEDIQIKIPVTKNGNYDLTAQKEIAQKHQLIQSLRIDLEDKLSLLSSYIIEM